MTEPALDAPTMNRLAFIRLLYFQAVELAKRPEPLSSASVLTFHDTVELFLILAAEHLGAPALPRDGAFLEYWRTLRPQRGYDKGVQLSGHTALGRLHHVRNDFKHAGRLPTRAEAEDAFSSVRRFLEDNTPKVFGIEFGDIDLVDVIPQIHIRNKLRAADAAEAAGKRTEAMGLLGSIFTGQFDPLDRRGRPFRFGRTLDPWIDNQEEPDEEGTNEGVPGQEGEAGKALEKIHEDLGRLGGGLAQVTDAVGQLQKAMRVIALGIDYGQFLRFEALTDVDLFHAATREEYNFCMQFAIDTAFRLADVEANAIPPSWWDW